MNRTRHETQSFEDVFAFFEKYYDELRELLCPDCTNIQFMIKLAVEIVCADGNSKLVQWLKSHGFYEILEYLLSCGK
jgi:hypothetical protein